MKKIVFASFLVLLNLNAFACDNTLFEDFGGETVFKKIVLDFNNELVTNEKTKMFFEKTDQERFKEKLYEQFCSLAGGPCTYTGQTMAKSHKGFDIDKRNFNQVAEILQDVMTKNHISSRLQNKLIALLAPLHKEIINK